MTIVNDGLHTTQPQTTPQPRPACPVCYQQADRALIRECRGVWLADFVCPDNHGYLLKWVAV
jgi:hypothetical protein